MKHFITTTVTIGLSILCLYLFAGCDSENLDLISAEEVYFFDNDDSQISSSASIFELTMDKKSDPFPKDWNISSLMFDSHENFDPHFFDNEYYYQVPSETVHKIDNGLAFNWLSVQKIIVDGEPRLKISVDANDTDKQRSAKINIIRYHTNNKGWYVGEVKVTQKGKSAS